jgi:hypothetical protein
LYENEELLNAFTHNTDGHCGESTKLLSLTGNLVVYSLLLVGTVRLPAEKPWLV